MADAALIVAGLLLFVIVGAGMILAAFADAWKH